MNVTASSNTNAGGNEMKVKILRILLKWKKKRNIFILFHFSKIHSAKKRIKQLENYKICTKHVSLFWGTNEVKEKAAASAAPNKRVKWNERVVL